MFAGEADMLRDNSAMTDALRYTRVAILLPLVLLLAAWFSQQALAQTSSTLQVISFQSTFSGFEAHLNRPLDTTVLNLYSTEAGGRGPADVMVFGAIVCPVRGSLIVDVTNRTVFVKTLTPLAPTRTPSRCAARPTRLYGGIHYSFDNQDGLRSGECIGRTILQRVKFNSAQEKASPQMSTGNEAR